MARPSQPIDLDAFLGARSLYHAPLRCSFDGGKTWTETDANAADLRVDGKSRHAIQTGGYHLKRDGPGLFHFMCKSVCLFKGESWITVGELDVTVNRCGTVVASKLCHDLVDGYRVLDVKAHADAAIESLQDMIRHSLLPQ
jgi:hypothetical protein